MVAESPFVLLLTGAPGAGKSEALAQVHDNLGADGIESAAIDTDELARSYPPIDFDSHLAHLKALAESFRQEGHDLLLVAATAESDEQLRAWLEAAGGERSSVVHLIARLRRRSSAWTIGPYSSSSTRQRAKSRSAVMCTNCSHW